MCMARGNKGTNRLTNHHSTTAPQRAMAPVWLSPPAMTLNTTIKLIQAPTWHYVQVWEEGPPRPTPGCILLHSLTFVHVMEKEHCEHVVKITLNHKTIPIKISQLHKLPMHCKREPKPILLLLLSEDKTRFQCPSPISFYCNFAACFLFCQLTRTLTTHCDLSVMALHHRIRTLQTQRHERDLWSPGCNFLGCKLTGHRSFANRLICDNVLSCFTMFCWPARLLLRSGH